MNRPASCDDLNRVGLGQYQPSDEMPATTLGPGAPSVVEQVLESSPAGNAQIQRGSESVILEALAIQLSDSALSLKWSLYNSRAETYCARLPLKTATSWNVLKENSPRVTSWCRGHFR